MKKTLPVIACLSLCSAASCGGDGATPDGGSTDSAPPIDSASLCHGLANTATLVQTIQIAEDRPDGAGGTIVEGRYHRIAGMIYTGSGGATGPYGEPVAETISLRAGQFRHISAWASGGDLGLLTYQTNGTSITLTFACPTMGGSPPIYFYTATPTSLTVFGWDTSEGVGPVYEYSLIEAW